MKIDKKTDLNYPLVTITFPVFNGGKEPLECLTSVFATDYPKDKIEVIVVDNHSTDDSVKHIKRQFPNVKLIQMEKNVGFASGINIGIKKSSGKYIFIGNDDTVFGKKSLKNMVRYINKHPQVGIVGGKIFLKKNPKKIVSCGYMMNLWTGNIYPAPDPDTIKEPDWIQGCAMLIPRHILDIIGLLDTRYGISYFEDFDLCLRARTAGYLVTYLPTAHFLHGQSTTADKNFPQKYYQWYKNKIRFVVKNLPLANVLAILLFQIIIITPFRAIILRDGRFIPFLKGLAWNIRYFGQTITARKIITSVSKNTLK